MENIPETLEQWKDTIKDDQKRYNEELEKNAAESINVKEGICTKEDEINQPENILFNAISESSLNILSDPALQKLFDVLKSELSESGLSTLTALMSICMSHSAYHAVVFHDELLRRELTKQFDNMVEHINRGKSDTGELYARVTVLEKKVGDIINDMRIKTIANH